MRLSAAVLAIFSLLTVVGCESKKNPEELKAGILYPKKEDIYLRAGRSFTLAEYYSLQETYPTLSPADILRLSVFSLILQHDLEKQGKSASLVKITQIVRVFLPPPPANENDAAIDESLRSLFNVGSRKELKDRLEKSLLTEPTQWNSPLLHEIRVEKTPWG